jgi:hypothetical protein
MGQLDLAALLFASLCFVLLFRFSALSRRFGRPVSIPPRFRKSSHAVRWPSIGGRVHLLKRCEISTSHDYLFFPDAPSGKRHRRSSLESGDASPRGRPARSAAALSQKEI